MPIMQNAYNKATMRIPIPNLDEFVTGGADPGSTYSNPLKIDSIEILSKESDRMAVKLIDTIDMNDTGLTIESYYRPIRAVEVDVDGSVSNADSTTNLTFDIDVVTASVNETGTHTGQTFNVDGISASGSDPSAIAVGQRVFGTGISSSEIVTVVSIDGTELTFDTSDSFALDNNTVLTFTPYLEVGWIIDNIGTGALGSTGRLYIKEIDGNTITLNKGITASDTTTLTFKKVHYRQTAQYIYKGNKPWKILPERQIIRTSDKIPVRAKAQELVSSRLVYGNITLGYQLPKDSDNRIGIDFTISDSTKEQISAAQTTGFVQDLTK